MINFNDVRTENIKRHMIDDIIANIFSNKKLNSLVTE